VLDFVEQFQHLRLTETSSAETAFVGHQHVRIERQCARDGDALALAAGELMRIARDAVTGRSTSSSNSRAFFSASVRGMP